MGVLIELREHLGIRYPFMDAILDIELRLNCEDWLYADPLPGKADVVETGAPTRAESSARRTSGLGRLPEYEGGPNNCGVMGQRGKKDHITAGKRI